MLDKFGTLVQPLFFFRYTDFWLEGHTFGLHKQDTTTKPNIP